MGGNGGTMLKYKEVECHPTSVRTTVAEARSVRARAKGCSRRGRSCSRRRGEQYPRPTTLPTPGLRPAIRHLRQHRRRRSAPRRNGRCTRRTGDGTASTTWGTVSIGSGDLWPTWPTASCGARTTKIARARLTPPPRANPTPSEETTRCHLMHPHRHRRERDTGTGVLPAVGRQGPSRPAQRGRARPVLGGAGRPAEAARPVVAAQPE
jgi:hypothetical protein